MLRREIEDVVKSKEVIIIINLCLDEILDPHCNCYIFVEVFGLGALWSCMSKSIPCFSPCSSGPI
jgi:hypothetical protein